MLIRLSMLVRKAIRSVHGCCDRGCLLHIGLVATVTLLKGPA